MRNVAGGGGRAAKALRSRTHARHIIEDRSVVGRSVVGHVWHIIRDRNVVEQAADKGGRGTPHDVAEAGRADGCARCGDECEDGDDELDGGLVAVSAGVGSGH